MPRKTGQLWLWTATVVVAVGTMSLTLVVAASASPRPLRGDRSKVSVAGKMDSLHAPRLPFGSSVFETWRAGVIDANIPPEAMQVVALQHGVSVGELAQALPREEEELDEGITEYDPWEGFNRAMFDFNQQVDRFVLKPVAKVWNFVVPDLAQQSLANAFDNIAMPRRLINSLLQLKVEGAGRELARFFLNISMGVGGFFDVATELGIPRSEEDTGQTLGHYGVGPGPYLVLPFLPPLTVRDGVGFAADAAMQPIGYVAPFAASAGMRGGQLVNERSLNLEAFEEFEEATFDLYTAVRNAYLQRRQRLIEE
ncbi:MAG TPA: VacJ family lipoprotein [Candidatus Tectomicrobia bacterium]|nr:VacJ family lipoprotein [Candidatus Tectomicrobia bacterium]